MLKKLLLGLLILIVAVTIGFFVPGLILGDIENETRVLVEKDRDHVWAKFQDESRMGDWLEGFKSIETIEKKEGVVGSTFKMKFENNGQEIEMIETMTGYKEGELFAFTLENEVMFNDVSVSLVDKGLTTEFIQKEKYHGQNVFWHSLFYWMKSSMNENSNKALKRFKKYAEGA